MDDYLVWVLVGFTLVIAELLTGTFYLLVLGVGAFAAAIIAWLGANMLVQAAVGGGVSLAGAWFVHHWHEAHRKADEGRSNFLDRGQAVVLDGWAIPRASHNFLRARSSTAPVNDAAATW